MERIPGDLDIRCPGGGAQWKEVLSNQVPELSGDIVGIMTVGIKDSDGSVFFGFDQRTPPYGSINVPHNIIGIYSYDIAFLKSSQLYVIFDDPKAMQNKNKRVLLNVNSYEYVINIQIAGTIWMLGYDVPLSVQAPNWPTTIGEQVPFSITFI